MKRTRKRYCELNNIGTVLREALGEISVRPGRACVQASRSTRYHLELSWTLSLPLWLYRRLGHLATARRGDIDRSCRLAAFQRFGAKCSLFTLLPLKSLKHVTCVSISYFWVYSGKDLRLGVCHRRHCATGLPLIAGVMHVLAKHTSHFFDQVKGGVGRISARSFKY